ncbi:MAG: hypothetical protein WA883_07185, partial [Phormidesmis sp.]
FGGGVFVRSGRLVLSGVRFEENAALAAEGADLDQFGFAGAGAQGKGGAIFVMPDDLATDLATPSVRSLGELPVFVHNVASDAAGLEDDNNDIYGEISFSNQQTGKQP